MTVCYTFPIERFDNKNVLVYTPEVAIFLKKVGSGEGKKGDTCQIFQGCCVMIPFFTNVITFVTINNYFYKHATRNNSVYWCEKGLVAAVGTAHNQCLENKGFSAKMGYYCTVPQCTSLAGKTKNVKFHRFPRDESMADKWNLILKRGKPYTKYSKVCSLHFTQADYNVTTMGKNKGSGFSMFP